MGIWLRRLRARIFSRRAEAELAEELRFHLERQAEALEAEGLDQATARRGARRRFGNTVLTAERCRDQRHLGWAEDAADDLRLAARGLGHAPGFTVAAMVLLALGIGAVTALFGPLYSLVLAPLPFPQANRLVRVGGWTMMPYGTLPRKLRRELGPVFTHIAEFSWGARPLDMGIQGTRGGIDTVTQGFFATLGVAPRLGRDFRRSDHELDGVIVSDAVWRTRLHATPHLGGAAIEIHGEPFPVLGVMPPGFDFPSGTQIWMLQPQGVGLGMFAPIIARLQPGLTLAEATVRLETIARAQGFTEGRVSLEPLRDYLLGNRRVLLWMLWAVALLFLLLACAGAANLILTRGVRRQPEIALRLALGAGRARVIRQLLAEALLLACGGAVLGLGLAAVAGETLRATLRGTLGATAMAPHSAMTASAGLVVVLAVAATVVCGLLPAWRAARMDANAYLKPSGSGRGVAPPGRGQFGGRELLTGGQLALALALLIASGLLIRSVEARLHLNFGFQPRGLIAVAAPPPPPPALVKARLAFDRLRRANHDISASRAAETIARKKSGLSVAGPAAERRNDLYRSAAQRELAGIPGVAAVGELEPLPFNGQKRPFLPIWVKPPAGPPYVVAYQRSAGGDFIRALGIRLLAGRSFSSRDDAGAAQEVRGMLRTWGSGREGYILPVVVNQALAQRFWPGQNALGKRFSCQMPCQVIGVVSNIHESSANLAVWPTVYWPVTYSGGDRFIVRLWPGTPVAAFRAAARRRLATLAPGMRPPTFLNMAARAEESWANLRMVLALLGCFAALGVIVAGLGVYAGAAQMAAARRREMGIRIALGARPEKIRTMALWRSARLAVWALPAGALAAWALARGLSHWLFQVGGFDPASYGVAAALLVALAVAAGYLPAERAARADPVAALRDDR